MGFSFSVGFCESDEFRTEFFSTSVNQQDIRPLYSLTITEKSLGALSMVPLGDMCFGICSMETAFRKL